MSIRNDELERLARNVPVLIAEKRSCRKCGYNLIGLKTDAKCPECGMLVMPPKRPATMVGHMSDAPRAWLAGYRRGTMLLCLGGWGIAAGLLAWAATGHTACVLFAAVTSLLWVAGTFVSTVPRPRMQGGVEDTGREWRELRIAARATQPAWTVALLWAAAAQGLATQGQLSSSAMVPVAALLLVGVAGWWPLMVLQSNLAYWASDTELADRLRNCSWAAAPGMGIGAAMIGVIGGMTGGLGQRFIALGYFAAGLSASVWIVLGLFALWYTLSTVWGLMRLGHYAMAAHMHVEVRDERLRQHARQAREGQLQREHQTAK